MAEDYGFTPEEMAVDDNLGYPKAYRKLCRNRGFGAYSHGPPFTFIPYALQEDEVSKWVNFFNPLFAFVVKKKTFGENEFWVMLIE